MVESVVSLSTLCQLLCIIAVSSLPISERGVTMGIILVCVCGIRWDNRWLQLQVKAFMLLMMRCSGYA